MCFGQPESHTLYTTVASTVMTIPRIAVSSILNRYMVIFSLTRFVRFGIEGYGIAARDETPAKVLLAYPNCLARDSCVDRSFTAEILEEPTESPRRGLVNVAEKLVSKLVFGRIRE